jgi:hypothetical protein
VDETQFHQFMAESYAQQRTPREPRPNGVDREDWKNRYRISAKLQPDLYADLMALCRQNDWSINTAINHLLSQQFRNVA